MLAEYQKKEVYIDRVNPKLYINFIIYMIDKLFFSFNDNANLTEL